MPPASPSRRSACLVCAAVVLFLSGSQILEGAPPEPRPAALTVQGAIDELRGRLGIEVNVIASIVAVNPLLVSVETVKDSPDTFLLSFEESFLAGLDEDELDAVIAHELGHVWIFTHHPYLQTERLANNVAMRVVSRETLHRVYVKVWERGGTKGDLSRFLGQ